MLNRRSVLKSIASLFELPFLSRRAEAAIGALCMTPQELMDAGNALMREVVDREQKWRDTCKVRTMRAFGTEKTTVSCDFNIPDVSFNKQVYSRGLLLGKNPNEFFEKCRTLAHIAATKLNLLVAAAQAFDPGRTIEVSVLNGRDVPYIEDIEVCLDGSIFARIISDVGVSTV